MTWEDRSVSSLRWVSSVCCLTNQCNDSIGRIWLGKEYENRIEALGFADMLPPVLNNDPNSNRESGKLLKNILFDLKSRLAGSRSRSFELLNKTEFRTPFTKMDLSCKQNLEPLQR